MLSNLYQLICLQEMDKSIWSIQGSLLNTEKSAGISKTQLDVEEIPSCVSQLHIRTHSQSIPCCSLTPNHRSRLHLDRISSRSHCFRPSHMPALVGETLTVNDILCFWLLCWGQAKHDTEVTRTRCFGFDTAGTSGSGFTCESVPWNDSLDESSESSTGTNK